MLVYIDTHTKTQKSKNGDYLLTKNVDYLKPLLVFFKSLLLGLFIVVDSAILFHLILRHAIITILKQSKDNLNG